jgi:hypothetical protein
MLRAKQLVFVFACALLWGSLSGVARADDEGVIHRLAANFNFAGEQNTTAAPGALGTGGIVIYDKTVSVPDDVNVLFVTISSTGDVHGNARADFACLVDGVPCNAGGSPSGWITLQRNEADEHDNSIYYTWGKKLAEDGGVHHIQLKLAKDGGTHVYIEKSHYYVDGAEMNGADACTGISGD